MEDRFKYPRTPHLPWSPGYSSDDIRNIDCSVFIGKEVVVSEKMDGENTTMYQDYIHARSIDGRHHPSRDWVKQLHSRISYEIPEGWRFCGENVYAQHSIIYNELQSYFYLFSIWDEKNYCLSWDDMMEWAESLDLATPQVFYRGEWNEKKIRTISINEGIEEGYVVRNAASFHFDEFRQNMAKWVRPNHVQTTEHWMHSEIVPNKLKEL